MREPVKPFWPSSNKDGPVEKNWEAVAVPGRNLGHIEQLLTWPEGVELPLPRWLFILGDSARATMENASNQDSPL